MLKINKDYSDYTDETDENYPEGKAINTSSAESVDGTPVLASFLNNIIGAFQGMYKKAFGNTKGINGIEDNVNQSQFVDAIEKYTQDKVKEHADKRGLVDGIHGATSSALGGQIVSRDALGSAEFSVPLSNTAAARRGDIYDLTKGVLCETPESEFSKEIPSSSYPGFTLQNGTIVRILFQFGASKETVLLEETEKLTLNVCETGAKKIFVKFNGVVKEIDRYEIEENTVYFQAFTDMNLIYIETLDEGNGGWLIMNNPVIISNNNEITYADGSIVYNKQTVDTMSVKKKTVQVSLGNWSSGSTTPYIPFKTAELDLTDCLHVYAITPRKRAGMYVDRWRAMVIGTTNDSEKKYLVGCYTDDVWVNEFSNAVVYLDVLYD